MTDKVWMVERVVWGSDTRKSTCYVLRCPSGPVCNMTSNAAVDLIMEIVKEIIPVGPDGICEMEQDLGDGVITIKYDRRKLKHRAEDAKKK